MAASNEDEKGISPLRTALLFVSKGLEKEDVEDLKFLCDFIPEHDLESVKTGRELFKILQKHQKITETDYSFVCHLLDNVHQIELKEKFLQKMKPAGDQSPQRLPFGSVNHQGNLKPPGDFTPTKPPVAQTGIFAGIPKPAKRLSDSSTGTNDSTPENISEGDWLPHLAYTLPRSATNKLPGQSQHLSQTLPRSRSEGPISSIDESPDKIKAVYNVDGTPMTTHDDRSPHTSKTLPRSRSASEEPGFSRKSFPLTENMFDVDKTSRATLRNDRSPYASETFPSSVKRSASAGPVLFTNSSPGTEAVCTPRTPTRDVQSLYASQTVLRPATRSLSYGPASSSDRNPGMKADLSASPNLSGKPMFHPKVSKSSGGNDGEGFGGQASGRDVENLLERLSLQDSSTSHDLPEDVETDSPFVPQKQSSLPNNGHGGDAASLLMMTPETDSPISSHQPRDDGCRHVVSSIHHGQGSVPWPGSPQQVMEVKQRAGKEAGGGQGTDSLDDTVHCKKCLAFICRTAELRWKGDNGHVTCISPDFPNRVKENKHGRPWRSKNIETLGLIFCQAEGCSQHFGISARFLELNPQLGYSLKFESFEIQRDGIKRTYKNWKRVLSKDTNT